MGISRLWFGEALHGVLSQCGEKYNNVTTGCPTSFPCGLALGATFNRTLWSNIADIISTEARALHNQNLAPLFYWAPNINLYVQSQQFIFFLLINISINRFRDPRWGRGQVNLF